MDALALLCSLHADGPLSLKRLRARGCNDLSTLIRRSADQLGDDLDVEPASARRLIREAKLLQARMLGDGLEAEEAPPIRSASPPAAMESPLLRPSVPVGEAAAPTVLDARDRSLVERIVAAEPPARPQGAPEPSSSPEEVVASPDERQVPEEALEPGASQAVQEAPEEVRAAQPVPGPERPPELAAEPESGPEPVRGALEAGMVAGLDADLVADLRASGIDTLQDLAAAESLRLTRDLGITFAQARRLGFLARRAASALPAANPPAATPPAATPPAATPPAGASKPVPESITESIAEPAPEPVAESASEPSRPFWEPRAFLSASESPDTAEQGVKVDPSEIAPRPRFSERLAEAARQRQLDDEARASAKGSTGDTVVGWNFEIPRPADEGSLPLGSVAAPRSSTRSETLAETLAETPAKAEGGSIRADGLSRDADPSGPFA